MSHVWTAVCQKWAPDKKDKIQHPIFPLLLSAMGRCSTKVFTRCQHLHIGFSSLYNCDKYVFLCKFLSSLWYCVVSHTHNTYLRNNSMHMGRKSPRHIDQQDDTAAQPLITTALCGNSGHKLGAGSEKKTVVFTSI
jgi:hypothetical protein